MSTAGGTITHMLTDAALLRLLQLASPTLPVGAYAYSQGLEYAVEVEWVRDEASALQWLASVLGQVLTWSDLAVLVRLHNACSRDDAASVMAWNDRLYALRETAELRAEDHQLGSSLARVLHDLGLTGASIWLSRRPTCFATLFALAAAEWGISQRAALLGYGWAWLESQTAAAIKLVPLGQSAGQRILSALQPTLATAVDLALVAEDVDIGRSLPGMVMASMQHARMYSRLFRS